jgi:uncharacterized protein with GYD domain
MQTFIMLTRLAPDAVKSPKALEDLERKAVEVVKAKCPKVKWKDSYAVTGPYDYIDIFEAPDLATAAQVSALIRTFGQPTPRSGAPWNGRGSKRPCESLGDRRCGRLPLEEDLSP